MEEARAIQRMEIFLGVVAISISYVSNIHITIILAFPSTSG